MLQSIARPLGALILGAALASPFAVLAQKAPPATAPTPGTKVEQVSPQVDTPKVASPPTPAQGSTAVPGWNNPPQTWTGISERPQYASIPGRETNVLIQGMGREWRQLHNGALTQSGGWLLVIVLALLAAVYLIAGPIKLHEKPTGRLIERFNAVERTAHWVTAICFVFLALTGLITFFGKHLVLPWLGYTGFSWVTQISKNLHNFVGPLFMFAIVVTFLLYVKDNMIGSEDFKWFSHLSGVWKGQEYPSGRFNGLEKAWFWIGLVILGVVMTVTGLILDFPNWNQSREAMQYSDMIHVIGAMLFIAAAFGHIYVGTIGMDGAYRAMRDGYVDEAWAHEHHALWYEEVKQGRRPEKIVAGTAQPVAGD